MAPAARRRQLRRTFDRRVDREWGRYSGDARRVLVRTLRERFLRRHLASVRGTLLEIGPGPGRFTLPILRASRGRVIAIDLSRQVLLRAQSRLRRDARRARISWIQGAGEHLPLGDRSVDSVILLGNIVCFAAGDGPRLLREVARVLRPGGVAVADFASPAAATQEFFVSAARARRLRTVLRRPAYYLIDQVLDTSYQPYLPKRLATWEFRFYTAEDACRTLGRAGFRVLDVMAVGTIGWAFGGVAASARREPRTWENLLRIEERLGRRSGTLETGHGFVVAAARAPRSSPPPERRPGASRA
jgi:ubiquinone/menaquinone biosynthesis C-methylase UbiE